MLKWILLSVCVSLPLMIDASESRDTASFKIQLAFLLDASQSMDGLIKQAQGQIWGMAGTMQKVRKKDKPVVVEYAIISYGNYYNNPLDFAYVHAGFSGNIDSLAEALLEIETYGGNECCGAVIQYALDILNWSKRNDDLKIIFIAGNESFDQCRVDYTKSIENAKRADVIVNTLYCGLPGIDDYLLWNEAAKLAGGESLTVEMDSIAKYSETFWDDKIIDLNDRLNETIVPQKSLGDSMYKKMLRLDEMTLWLGKHIMCQRTAQKATKSLYEANWDLVNLYQRDRSMIDRTDTLFWPENLEKLSAGQREIYLQKKIMQRRTYAESVALFMIKADEQRVIEHGTAAVNQSFDKAVLTCVQQQGRKRKFQFPEEK